MRSVLAPVLLISALLASCKDGGGGTSTETATGSGTTSSSTTGTGGSSSGVTTGATSDGSGGASSGGGSSSGAGSTTGVQSSGPDTAGSSSGPDTTGGSSGPDTTTGGGSALMFTLVEPQVFSDCMPIVAPDPLHAQWTVVADNTAGMAPALVTLKSASIVFDPDGAMDTHAIVVAPTMFGPIPPGVSQMFTLVKKDTPGGLASCAHCGQKVRFVFEWTIDGAPATVQDDEVMQCAF